jgi:hypothetical protein
MFWTLPLLSLAATIEPRSSAARKLITVTVY